MPRSRHKTDGGLELKRVQPWEVVHINEKRHNMQSNKTRVYH